MTREEINEEKQKEIFKEQNIEKTKKIIKLIVKITLSIIVISFLFFATHLLELTYYNLVIYIMEQQLIMIILKKQ